MQLFSSINSTSAAAAEEEDEEDDEDGGSLLEDEEDDEDGGSLLFAEGSAPPVLARFTPAPDEDDSDSVVKTE